VTPVTADNITRHELIGLDAKISGASNKSQNRIKGLITEETRNTLTISHGKKERIVAKDEASFIFNLGDTSVEVEGKTLIGRPEDRVKKKPRRDW
jgi:ribonuclease P protein subunit POP4